MCVTIGLCRTAFTALTPARAPYALDVCHLVFEALMGAGDHSSPGSLKPQVIITKPRLVWTFTRAVIYLLLMLYITYCYYYLYTYICGALWLATWRCRGFCCHPPTSGPSAPLRPSAKAGRPPVGKPMVLTVRKPTVPTVRKPTVPAVRRPQCRL